VTPLPLKLARDAAKRGLLQPVKELLETGPCPSPTSLLRLVANDYHSIKKKAGHVDLARFLLENGASVDREMVYQSARSGCADLVSLLLVGGDNEDVFMASAAGSFEVVQRLLKLDATLARSLDAEGRTPLHYCCASSLGKGNVDATEVLAAIASTLLKSGAPVDAPAHCGGLDLITPLEHTCWTGGNATTFHLLLQRGARPTSRALWAALGHFQRHGAGHYELAAELLQCGIDINENDGRTLLHAFSAHEDARGVDWLLEHGADTAARDANGCTPLHHVGRRNRGIKVAKLLLAAGACVAALDDDGYTPIHFAKQKGQDRLVALMTGSLSVS
jgi:ankyrin repeat protein